MQIFGVQAASTSVVVSTGWEERRDFERRLVVVHSADAKELFSFTGGVEWKWKWKWRMLLVSMRRVF